MLTNAFRTLINNSFRESFYWKRKKKKQYREREMGSSYIFFNLLNLSRSNSKKRLSLMLIF